jgi:hypothetical protein
VSDTLIDQVSDPSIATCDSGTMVGGGAIVTQGEGQTVVLASSGPDSDTTWTVTVATLTGNAGGADASVTAYALCTGSGS